LTPENVPFDSPKEVYEVYFVFACIWAFGGALLKDQVGCRVLYRTGFICMACRVGETLYHLSHSINKGGYYM
jgi:hypothetical protein